jgi:acetyl esterase
MTPVKRPIHPIYNEICEERSRQSAAVAKILEDPTPEKLYQFILKLRERQDELSSAFPLPETIRTTKEITHNNITVKVTIFRPLGTENQVLPVLVFW